MNKTVTLAALALALAPAMSHAGQFLGAAVSINTSASTARGSLVATRISPNKVEFINCSVTTNSVSSGIVNAGFCTARDALGNLASCSTTESELMKAMQAITPASDVRFSWDANGHCSQIFVRNASSNLE